MNLPMNGRGRSAEADWLTPSAREVLAVLREAYDCARTLHVADWQCAVEIGRLYARGISESTLRLLLGKNWAEHRLETTHVTSKLRTFQKISRLGLPKAACFVLTVAGLDLLANANDGVTGNGLSDVISFASTQDSERRPRKPFWDGLGALWLGNQVIKTLSPQARRQRTLLDAFQEEHWPRRLDDPLPGDGRPNRRERLRQAIRHLNENHQFAVVHFHMEVAGKGLYWEKV